MHIDIIKNNNCCASLHYFLKDYISVQKEKKQTFWCIKHHWCYDHWYVVSLCWPKCLCATGTFSFINIVHDCISYKRKIEQVCSWMCQTIDCYTVKTFIHVGKALIQVNWECLKKLCHLNKHTQLHGMHGVKVKYFSRWHSLKDIKCLRDSLKYFYLGIFLWRAAAVITEKRERKKQPFKGLLNWSKVTKEMLQKITI